MSEDNTQTASTGRDLPYVLDLDYPSQFIQQQMPVMLSYVAALSGFRPPSCPPQEGLSQGRPEQGRHCRTGQSSRAA